MTPLCSECTPVLQEAARRVFWLNQENDQLRKKTEALATGSSKVVDALETVLKISLTQKTRGCLSDEDAAVLAAAIEPCAELSENLVAGLDELRRRQWGKKAKPHS